MSSCAPSYTSEQRSGRRHVDVGRKGIAPSLVIVDALARVMRERDADTFQHSERVRRYALALAAERPVGDARTLAALDAAALLHDIGKLGIPESLLNKPAPLTAEEYEQVKQHAAMGARILSSFAFPGPLAVIVRHHHEHWDGSGYPDGLSGTAIPLGARLLAVADCYDALTSNRPYRDAIDHARAVEMMAERRGWMHDPDITDAFLDLSERMRGREANDLWRGPTVIAPAWLSEAGA